ncbi:unnamed protein product, partial [marine sediment metagenome]
MIISKNEKGTLFESIKQQEKFLGVMESGPLFEILQFVANVNLSLISKYFYILNQNF